MNCSEIQSRLSAYHDSELSDEDSSLVSSHLAECPTCSAELAYFEKLSGLSRRLTDPPIPGDMWESLEERILTGTEVNKSSENASNLRHRGRLFAIAAAILFAIGLGVTSWRSWHEMGGHDHLADNFGSFLDEFESRPDDAQQFLLASYEGRPATLQEATEVLGYEPVAAKRLPAGCSIDKVYLLKMPCCTCAQITCRNENGSHLAIFEHDIDQPVWFGDRPTLNCVCNDVPTSVVQVGDKLAATWKEGKRFVTIVGADSLEEVSEFVGHLSGKAKGAS